jgi:L,D-transpeptidase ErfK/SrfK
MGLAAGLAVLFAVAAARADPYTMTEGSDLIGETTTHTTVDRDTLAQVAEAHGLPVADVIAANPGIDPWLPGVDVILVVPTIHLLPDGPREGLVINLPERRMYRYLSDRRVRLFSFSIGHAECELPIGETSIKKRRRKPSWRPPVDIRAWRPDLDEVVPFGPRNPLGEYALDLALPGRIIHGAAHPFKNRTDRYGCVQVYPEEAKELYLSSTPGMTVRVVDQAVKLGWSAGELIMEAYPTLGQAAGTAPPAALTGLDQLLDQAAGDDAPRIDRSLARKTARERRGVPVRITRPQPPPPKAKKVRGLFGD